MSPIDMLGIGNTASGPFVQHSQPGSRQGTQKAIAIQPSTTEHPGAPVEKARAVLQNGAGTRSMLTPNPAPGYQPEKIDIPAPQMTAILLHELRLQKELANLQARKHDTPNA